MAKTPPHGGKPADGEPLWVDADWWREMLRGRNEHAERPAGDTDGGGPTADPLAELPTAPQPAFGPRRSASDPGGNEPGVDGPPLQAPGEPSSAFTPPGAAPAPPASAGPPPAPDARVPAVGLHPKTGDPAPPAVPRAKRGSRAIEPAPTDRGLHVPRVAAAEPPLAEGVAKPPLPARTGLPPRPVKKAARPAAKKVLRPSAKAVRPARASDVPPPSGYAGTDSRPRAIDFFLRHVGDVALLLLALGVITLVYLALRR